MSARFDLLFVYGSLMRGQSADGYLAHLPSSEATCRGQLYRAPAGYPALILDPDGPLITGQVVRFSEPSLLMVLDLYENTSMGIYKRVRTPITVRGRVLDAWIYVTTAQQARRHRFHKMAATDWRTVAPPPKPD